jgi:hypothetical protein
MRRWLSARRSVPCTDIPNGPRSWVEWAAARIVITFETEDVPLAPPSTPEDIKSLLAQAMVDVHARRLDPRIASTLTYMAGALLKAIEGTDVQRRLARLEEENRAKVDKS